MRKKIGLYLDILNSMTWLVFGINLLYNMVTKPMGLLQFILINMVVVVSFTNAVFQLKKLK